MDLGRGRSIGCHPFTTIIPGRRLYTDRDAKDLQKIICFKFLGYSLEQIRAFMKDACFDAGLIEALQEQKRVLEERKEHIETGLKAIDRTIGLLEEEEEIDSSVFMSLLNSIQIVIPFSFPFCGWASQGLYSSSKNGKCIHRSP